MQHESIRKGLRQGIHGLKDPGNALILVYIFLVFIFLLLAGLQSARADYQQDRKGGITKGLHARMHPVGMVNDDHHQLSLFY